MAWLSLDAGDNDPRRFLAHLLASLEAAGAATPEAGELLEAVAAVPVEAVLTSLVNQLDQLPGPTVIALDDYHVIEAPEIHQAVTFLLDHLPPRVTLAIATRADPPLPLPRLRARGELVELRAAELRFTPEEAGAFLTGVMGLPLTDDQVAALEARTEGWVAGLQLAGLSLRGVDDAAPFVEDFTGSHRFVLDYLVEEVLRRQPDDVRAFLLDTAVLHRLTGPLCDAVTGRSDGTAMLEALERDNLFVVPLDTQRRWYRYHHLFADALRARSAAEQPNHVAALHRRASDWYAAHGLPEDAVAHALAGDDPERAADLVEAALPDLRRERQDRLLRQWLTALPDEAVRKRALLATYRGWTRLVEGDLDGLTAWLDDAERALAASPPTAAAGASVATQEELRTPAGDDRDLPGLGRTGPRRHRRHHRARPPGARRHRPGGPHGPRRRVRLPRAGRLGAGRPRRGGRDLHRGGAQHGRRRRRRRRARQHRPARRACGWPAASRRRRAGSSSGPWPRPTGTRAPRSPPTPTCTSGWPTCSSTSASSTPRRST